jgi:hypothetical protein
VLDDAASSLARWRRPRRCVGWEVPTVPFAQSDHEAVGVALMLVLQGVVVPMRDGAPASVPGAVWIDDDGLIAAVTPLKPGGEAITRP